jgi:exopolysaccharide production protein ExoQ
LTNFTNRQAIARARQAHALELLVEIAAGFFIVLPLLFVAQLSSLGPAASFLATLLYAWARRRRVVEIIQTRWFLLLVPAFALLSAIWSDYPGVTVKHALELWLTAFGGIMLSASPNAKGALTGVWGAFACYLIISFALGHSVGFVSMADDASGGDAFSGLNNGKNLLGMTAAMGVILSFFLLCDSLRRRSAVAAAAIVVLALELYLVNATRSTGAVVALSLATVAFLAVIGFSAISHRMRPAAGGLLAVALIGFGFIAYRFGDGVLQTTLGVLHKDPTLTGRSYLWYRAADYIRERPLLGHGFEAFWVQGNVDAEGLWQYGQVDNRFGFNFHNTLIELLVHQGVIGAVVYIGVYLAGLLLLMRSAIRQPSLTAATFLGLVVFHLARTPFESLMPSSVDFSTFLLFAALGFGSQPTPMAAPALGPMRHWRGRDLRESRPLAGAAGSQ